MNRFIQLLPSRDLENLGKLAKGISNVKKRIADAVIPKQVKSGYSSFQAWTLSLKRKIKSVLPKSKKTREIEARMEEMRREIAGTKKIQDEILEEIKKISQRSD